MKRAGCVALNLAIESGDEHIVNQVIKKGISLNAAERVAGICRKLGIITNAYFVIGLPGENETTIDNSIRFMEKLPLDKISVFIVTPFPGTELFNTCVEKGYLAKEQFFDSLNRWDTSLFGRVFYETGEFTRARLEQWQMQFISAFYAAKFKRAPLEVFREVPLTAIKLTVHSLLGERVGAQVVRILKRLKQSLA